MKVNGARLITLKSCHMCHVIATYPIFCRRYSLTWQPLAPFPPEYIPLFARPSWSLSILDFIIHSLATLLPASPLSSLFQQNYKNKKPSFPISLSPCPPLSFMFCLFSFKEEREIEKTMAMYNGVETTKGDSPDGPDRAKSRPPRDSRDLPSLMLSSCYPITLKVNN